MLTKLFVFRYLLRVKTDNLKHLHPRYQSFEDPGLHVEAIRPECLQGNGRSTRKPASSNVIHRDDLEPSEFMTCGSLDTYRAQPNNALPVSVVAAAVSAQQQPSFRLRVSEYSEERKRSFVRLSKIYRQPPAHQSAQVSC